MKKTWFRATPLKPRAAINNHCRLVSSILGLPSHARKTRRNTSAAPTARNWARASGPNPTSASFPATMFAAQQNVANSMSRCIEA